jgi:hypothetical protein
MLLQVFLKSWFLSSIYDIIFPFYIVYTMWCLLHIRYHIHDIIVCGMISDMISQKQIYNAFLALFFMDYCPWYPIHFIKICLQYQKLMCLSIILDIIRPSDISNLVNHSPLISQIWRIWCYLSLYHCACGTWKLGLFQVEKIQDERKQAVTLTYKFECPSHILLSAQGPKFATYSSLISYSCRQSCSRLGHSGVLSALRRSQPGRLGITVTLAQPYSQWRYQMAVMYRPYRCNELVHVTAQATIFEIQLHKEPFQTI